MEHRGNIDDILNEDVSTTDDTSTDTGTTDGTTDTGTTDDAGTTGTTDTTTVASTAASTAAPVTEDAETVAALRKEIDRIRNKNREYEAELAKRPAPAATPAEEPPSFWDNPEAVIERRVAIAEQQMTQRLINISEASAKARHADYDDKFQVFAGIVKQNPHVYQEMLAQPDPAEWAYQVAARQSVMRDIGDPVEYRSKLEKEIRDQIAAEQAIADKKKADELIADKLPKSFSESRNVGTGVKTTQFNPNIGMKDILNGPSKK